MRLRSSSVRLIVAILLCVTGLNLTGCSFLRHPRKFCTVWDEKKLQDASRALQKGDLDKAEDLVQDVLRRSPHNDEARRRIIEMYLQQDRLGEALEQMELAIKLSPDDCQIYCNLAALLMEQNRARDARKIIDLALRMEPANPRLLLMKGKLLEQDHNPVDAQEIYYRLLEVDRENAEALFRLARLSLENNNPTQSLPLLRQVIQHSETSAERRSEAEDLLATAYARTERWQQAAAVLEQHFCEKTPGPDDLYRLGYAQYRCGNIDGAKATLQQLRELDPKSKAVVALTEQVGSHGDQLLRTAAHQGEDARMTGYTPILGGIETLSGK
ncbi:MAG: tetratricopeptide repeat protein [Planctomycetales bacterium]